MTVDDFTRDLLRSLQACPASAAEDLYQPLLETQRPNVMYSNRTIEHALFEAERGGLVQQVEVDIAQAHPRGTPAVGTTRCWELTDAGAAEVAAG